MSKQSLRGSAFPELDFSWLSSLKEWCCNLFRRKKEKPVADRIIWEDGEDN